MPAVSVKCERNSAEGKGGVCEQRACDVSGGCVVCGV